VTNIHPYSYTGLSGELPRGKMDMEISRRSKRGQPTGAQGAAETDDRGSGYPHYYSCSKRQHRPVISQTSCPGATATVDLSVISHGAALVVGTEAGLLLVSGEPATPSLRGILHRRCGGTPTLEGVKAFLLDRQRVPIDDVNIVR